MAPEDVANEAEPQPLDQDQAMDAAEYVHDDKQTEQIQGKLATDQVDDDANEVKDDQAKADGEDMPMEEDQAKEEEKAAQLQEEKVERTQAQFKDSAVLKPE